MEKFFIVSSNSDLGKDYLDYKENIKTVNEHVKKFTNDQGIISHKYHASNNLFYIVPVEEDVKKFDNVLGKDLGNGLRPFKKNSTINKAWIKSLKDLGIKILHKPEIVWCFKDFAEGKFSERLFDIDSIIYCSFSWGGDIKKYPKGMTEIKASEFWKIVEDRKN